MKKIGIMGGTFDPPHIAHMAMAQQVMETLHLDEVRFIPTGNISYKESRVSASPEERLEMVRLSVKGDDRFSVDPIEVEKSGYSYTFETMETLCKKSKDSEYFFIVGADSLDYMDKWKEPERIFACCKIAAVARRGYSYESIDKKKRELENRFDAKIEIVKMPIIEISSTELRERISRGESIRYLVRDEVENYILSHMLYREET